LPSLAGKIAIELFNTFVFGEDVVDKIEPLINKVLYSQEI